MSLDPVKLSQVLIRCPSVTPEEGGALDALEKVLDEMGFNCQRLPFSEEGTPSVDNLYARLGEEGPNLCFAGHTDVVPVGDEDAWTVDPFGADIRDEMLYGRGTSDMKCAIACWISAIVAFLKENGPDFKGSISFLITGDEEGPAINGTRKMLSWLEEQGEKMDACIIGEPTSSKTLGDTVKIGRRGSVTFDLKVHGIQGHVAYPDLADNPVGTLIKILHRLEERTLDKGTEYFQPSNLEITTIDVGNPASNVIPAEARARFNIRFNDTHRPDDLIKWVREECQDVTSQYKLEPHVSGDAFLTQPGYLSSTISEAVQEVTGSLPELSTSGGTSDARFIKDICPVVELGMLNATAHQIDEHVAVKDIRTLSAIYQSFIKRYFSG